MKVFNFLGMFILLSVLGMSCTNDEGTDVYQANSAIQTKSFDENVRVQEVAELISSIDIDEQTMNEVKTGVDYSLKYGLDEVCRFTDILNPQESKLFRHSNVSYLSQKMNVEYGDCMELNRVSDMDKMNFFNMLKNSDIQIYWPYSKLWNGTDKPIVVYGSEDNQYAYHPIKKANNIIVVDTIQVTTEFLKENVVWVISNNDTPYDELPDFCKEEFVNKDGVFFYSQYAVNVLNKSRNLITPESGVYLDKIEALQKFEGGLAGGPEFQFYWCHADYFPGIMNTPKGSYNAFRYNMSLNEVKQEIQLNYRIRPSWPSDERTNALVVLEKDGGKDRTGTRNITYRVNGNDVNVIVSFPYEKNDETVFDQIFEQRKIYGDDNLAASGDLKRYYNGDRDFWITIAVK